MSIASPSARSAGRGGITDPLTLPDRDSPRQTDVDERLPLPRRIARSFRFAFEGLFYLFRTQRNARIHLIIAVVACVLSAWLRISRVEWAIIVLMIAIVLILEGLNTAIEAA